MAIKALGFGLYAIAFACFYLATSIAPNMQWPSNDIESIAAGLLVIGCIAKLGGAIAILRLK